MRSWRGAALSAAKLGGAQQCSEVYGRRRSGLVVGSPRLPVSKKLDDLIWVRVCCGKDGVAF
jgi:hypothetical protein